MVRPADLPAGAVTAPSPPAVRRPRLSIAGIVTVGLVAAATLLLGALAFVGYDTYRSRQREEFRREHEVLADQLATSLALPLWNFDRGVVNEVMDGAMRDNDVAGILIRTTDRTATIIAEARDAHWRPVAAAGDFPAAGLLVEKRGILVAGDTIGQVQVFATPRFLEARLRQTLVSIVGFIGLLDLILFASLYLLLWRTVLRPLREVERDAVAVSSGDRAGGGRPPGRYLGELESLRQSIEKMIAMLAARYAELQKSEARYRGLAETLRESEEKFSTAFRASPDPILISDLETGRVLDANEGFLRIYGSTRENAVGRTTFELGLWVDPADRDGIVAALRAHGSLRNRKISNRMSTGRLITVLLSSELVKLRGQWCILTVVHDITDQEEAEAALRESEEKFSTAFRSSPDAMAIAEETSGCYLEVNGGFERLFGYSRAETLGRTSLDLGIWPDAASRHGFLERLRAEGAVRDLEVSGQNRRGEKITYLLSAEGIELQGRTCVVSVVHDITDRKHAEDEHARSVERERRARDEFTQRLIASQEAERSRIAGELHDSLGQNLLLIKNRAQLALASGAIPPDLAWQLESIQDMAGQSITEVRQISHDLRPYQLDQLGLTRALEALVDGAARNTGFQFTKKLDAVDDVLSPDAATNLYRIVQESLNNILHHARAHHAHVALERDLRELRLLVEDDGRGFTPGEPAPARTEGGFGLRNVAERVRILGGVLCINSAPGRGTRVELTIPLPDEV